MHRYYVSGDPGRFQDPGAISVLQRSPEVQRLHTANAPRWAERVEKITTHYDLIRLEQPGLGGRYAEWCDRVAIIMQHEQLVGQAVFGLDATGVGAPVVEMLGERGVQAVPIVITSGKAISRNAYGWYNVPKLELMTPLQLLFQTKRIHFAQRLRLKDKLVKQLTEFRMKITGSANVKMEAEGSDADDLVLAVAIGAFIAETLERQSAEDGIVDEEMNIVEDYDPLEYGNDGGDL